MLVKIQKSWQLLGYTSSFVKIWTLQMRSDPPSSGADRIAGYLIITRLVYWVLLAVLVTRIKYIPGCCFFVKVRAYCCEPFEVIWFLSTICPTLFTRSACRLCFCAVLNCRLINLCAGSGNTIRANSRRFSILTEVVAEYYTLPPASVCFKRKYSLPPVDLGAA